MSEEARPIRFWSGSSEGAWLSAFRRVAMTDEEGLSWDSLEVWYQAGKARDGTDAERIRQCADARTAKRLGRTIAIREDWDEHRNVRMAQGMLMRFAAGSDEAARLVATGNRPLVHETPWGARGDPYWGTGRDGRGENRYGRMIEVVREGLCTGAQPSPEEVVRRIQ